MTTAAISYQLQVKEASDFIFARNTRPAAAIDCQS